MGIVFASSSMGLPSQAVNLSPEQIGRIYAELRKTRHDINNKLACIQACVELVVYKPEEIHRLASTVREQSAAMQSALGGFSGQFEQLVGITLPLDK